MKMMRIKSEKGQGLTEYVLILAFVAGIAMMMFGGGGLKGTLVNTFTETVSILGGLFDEKIDWGKMDPSKSFNDSNQAERYQHDQKMLENLANFFMGMEKKDVAKLLNSVGDVTKTSDSGNILLGNIVRDENGNVHFLVRSLKANPTEEGYIGTMTINDGTYNYGYNDRIFNWMQGDYGPKDNRSYNLDYASSYNYMVSDYAIEQFKRDNYNWNQQSFNMDSNGKEVGGNGVKVRLGYTNDDGKIVVDKVRVTIDNGSLNPNDKSTSAYSSSFSNGLEVTVKKGQDPQITNVGVGKGF